MNDEKIFMKTMVETFQQEQNVETTNEMKAK